MNKRPLNRLIVVSITQAALLCALSACSSLLPASHTKVVSEWHTYDEAVASLNTFEPYHSSRADVHRAGLDPKTNAAIKVLHFADVLQRFSAAALLTPNDLDPGIRDCVRAGRLCAGYEVSVTQTTSTRVGNFFLDSLAFSRETVTEGWRVDALLIFVGDQLVYELVGGQPTISEHEVRRNPLGPLQSWGDSAMGALMGG